MFELIPDTITNLLLKEDPGGVLLLQMDKVQKHSNL